MTWFPPNKPVHDLSHDVSNGRLAGHVEFHQTSEAESKMQGHWYVDAKKRIIYERFSESIPVLEAMTVFDPLLIPQRDSCTFTVHWTQQVKILSGHFHPGDSSVQESILAEWGKLDEDNPWIHQNKGSKTCKGKGSHSNSSWVDNAKNDPETVSLLSCVSIPPWTCAETDELVIVKCTAWKRFQQDEVAKRPFTKSDEQQNSGGLDGNHNQWPRVSHSRVWHPDKCVCAKMAWQEEKAQASSS